MRAMCGGGERRAEDDEERGSDERRLAPNSVAQKADRDLAKDRAWEGSRSTRLTVSEQTLWAGPTLTDEQCVRHTGGHVRRVISGIELFEHDLRDRAGSHCGVRSVTAS